MSPPKIGFTPPRSVPGTQSKPDSQDNTTPGSASCATHQASKQFESSGTGTEASKKETLATPPKKEAKSKKPKKDKKDKK